MGNSIPSTVIDMIQGGGVPHGELSFSIVIINNEC